MSSVLVRVTIAEKKHQDQSNLGRKGVIPFTTPYWELGVLKWTQTYDLDHKAENCGWRKGLVYLTTRHL